MVIEKPEENVYWNKIESLLRRYKEFFFFLAGLILGYIMRAV